MDLQNETKTYVTLVQLILLLFNLGSKMHFDEVQQPTHHWCFTIIIKVAR